MQLIVRQLPMKADWRDNLLPLRDLAEETPLINNNWLPLLTENNFQTSPFFICISRLLIFRLSVGGPPFIKTPQI